jgi:hypothetical protein
MTITTADALRVITVRQPFATLIAAGHKRIENRSWPTSYRGTLAIHAGLAVERDALAQWAHLLPDELPTGMILATVQLTDCQFDTKTDHPFAEPQHWHWTLANPEPLPEPIPCRGRLGLWRANGMVA